MENRDYEIKDAIEAGKEHYKSQSFDQSIMDLYEDGIISKEKALENATSASDLALKISGLNSSKYTSSDINEDEDKSVVKKAELDKDDIFDLK